MNKKVLKTVKNANIVATEAEIQEIVNRLGEENVESISPHGLKHWKVVRELRFKEVDEMVKDEEIVSKYFCYGVAGYTAVSVANTGGIFYVRVILTKNKIYAVGYDQLFRIVSKSVESLSNISRVKQAKQGAMLVIPYDSLMVKFKNGENVTVVGKGELGKKDLASIVNDLKALGADIEENKFE